MHTAYNRSGATWAVYSRLLKGFGILVFFTNGISGKIFGLILSFLSNMRHRVVLDRKALQEYPFNAGVPQVSVLGPTLSYYALMTFLMVLSVTLLSMLMILLLTLIVISVSIWSVGTTRVGFWTWTWAMTHCRLGHEKACWFQCWKNFYWFPLTGLITLMLLIWKWIGLFLKKNNLLRCWDYLLFLNWSGTFTLSLSLELHPRKLKPWFVLWSFFLLKLLLISINVPYGLAWNTVSMCGLVP